jgi:charged multivesicular body protein 6
VLTDRETSIAKECLARGDKARALLALRRKKYQESLLAKTDTQLSELEKLTTSVEFALVQKDVLFGLSQGTKVLQAIHKEIGGLEAVEKMMGETEEAMAYQQVRLPFPCLCHNYLPTLRFRNCRKSAKCSADKCPTRMRTRWRMNLSC